MSSNTSSVNRAASESSDTINLNVLCPSLQSPGRFTIENIPTTSTVAGLKDRISNALDSRPAHEAQRLIYRGKPLSEGSTVLRNIFDPADVSMTAPCYMK